MKWPWLLNSRMSAGSPGRCWAWESDTSLLFFLHDRSHIHPAVGWAIDFFEIQKKKRIPSIGLNVYLANCNLHPLHSCILLYPQKDAESILGFLLCERFDFWNCLATIVQMKQARGSKQSRPDELWLWNVYMLALSRIHTQHNVRSVQRLRTKILREK